MDQANKEQFYSFLQAYAEAVDLLLEASEMVSPELADQVLLRAGEELEHLLPLCDPGRLSAEQYAAISERCWLLEAKLQARFL